MVCVQSDVTPPLVNAFESGADDTTVVTAGHTLSTGLNVPGGVGHFRVLQIIRASGGAAVAVSEDDTAAEFARLWRDDPLGGAPGWVSPEGAACLAALPLMSPPASLLLLGLLTLTMGLVPRRRTAAARTAVGRKR